jgi:hypothetical protein
MTIKGGKLTLTTMRHSYTRRQKMRALEDKIFHEKKTFKGIEPFSATVINTDNNNVWSTLLTG